jgi:flavodoxin
MESLIVLVSYHHNNTEKVASVIAEVLGAEIKTPQEVHPGDLQGYSLVGFGSGIYGGHHHQALLDLADRMPRVADGKAFLFSTSGATWEAATNHVPLKDRLQSKGYVIVDEFSCLGHNTNSFLKLFGGMNKGRPNAEDLKQAKEFAVNLKRGS